MVAQRDYATNVTLYFLPVDVRNQIHVLRVFPVGPFVRVKKYAVRVRYYVSAVFSLSPMFVTKAISEFFNYWVPFVCTTGEVALFSFADFEKFEGNLKLASWLRKHDFSKLVGFHRRCFDIIDKNKT